jgi:hypothetical protein
VGVQLLNFKLVLFLKLVCLGGLHLAVQVSLELGQLVDVHLGHVDVSLQRVDLGEEFTLVIFNLVELPNDLVPRVDQFIFDISNFRNLVLY